MAGSGKKAEYRNSRRSKNLICDAFLEVAQEKSLDKITVTDVITKADVNRGTFYAHYPDIHALINQYENELIAQLQRLVEETPYEEFLHDPLQTLKKISAYLQKNETLYRKLSRSPDASMVLARLKDFYIDSIIHDERLPEGLRTSAEFNVLLRYYSGGFFDVYMYWLRNEIRVPLETVTWSIAAALIEGTQHLIELDYS